MSTKEFHVVDMFCGGGGESTGLQLMNWVLILLGVKLTKSTLMHKKTDLKPTNGKENNN